MINRTILILLLVICMMISLEVTMAQANTGGSPAPYWVLAANQPSTPPVTQPAPSPYIPPNWWNNRPQEEEVPAGRSRTPTRKGVTTRGTPPPAWWMPQNPGRNVIGGTSTPGTLPTWAQPGPGRNVIGGWNPDRTGGNAMMGTPPAWLAPSPGRNVIGGTSTPGTLPAWASASPGRNVTGGWNQEGTGGNTTVVTAPGTFAEQEPTPTPTQEPVPTYAQSQNHPYGGIPMNYQTVPSLTQAPQSPYYGFGTNYGWGRARGWGGGGGYSYSKSAYRPAWMMNLNSWNFGE